MFFKVVYKNSLIWIMSLWGAKKYNVNMSTNKQKTKFFNDSLLVNNCNASNTPWNIVVFVSVAPSLHTDVNLAQTTRV